MFEKLSEKGFVRIKGLGGWHSLQLLDYGVILNSSCSFLAQIPSIPKSLQILVQTITPFVILFVLIRANLC